MPLIRGVDVSISPDYQENLPGGELEYTVTIKNIGNVNDNYSLENFDNENWALTLDNDLLTIPAGENRKATLRVTIPENADNGTRDNITVTVTSQENSQISANASCIAHAAPEEFTLQLVAGWNLIGFQVTNENMTPNQLFAGTTFKMSYWNAPFGPYGEAPKDQPVDDNRGYWVKLNQDDNVVVYGDPPKSHTIYLAAGWNLVNFPLTSASTTPDKLFAGTTFKMSYWNAPFGPYSEAPDNAPVKLGVGYWAKVNQNTTATVPL